MVSRLPRHSQYKAALDDDDEFAELAAALDRDEDDVVRISLVGYDPVAIRLDNIFDVLNCLNETLIAVNSAKSSALTKPNRATRPQTAYQRYEKRRATERLDSIVDRMTGGR